MKKYYFTSESVTEGHPDKVCDNISDTILDECLKQDENSRVAIETFASSNTITIAGQITSTARIKIGEIVREKLKEIGYDNAQTDIDYRTCNINADITKQSADIALGVDVGGAGDQGIMFGYACDETPNYMPFAIDMAHKLARRLTQVRKEGIVDFLRPDGKTQVTVEYEDDKPKRIETILISTQHLETATLEEVRQAVIENVIKQVVSENMMDENTKIYVNPTGRFVIGGPHGDSGLTGRKIIVDTYGGYARHGGGAFSGKDPTKVDRSAAYMARYIAKNVVAANMCDELEIQLSYAIGVKEPTSIYIDTKGTEKVPHDVILEAIKQEFDLTPAGIIHTLNLRTPIYKKTASYGHFGRPEANLPWEQLDKVENLKKYM